MTYKGFDKDLKCRGFKYEIGKEYTAEGEISACENGFRACAVPLDAMSYYPPGDSRYCEVEQSGEISKGKDDSKVASQKIKIGAEIGLTGLIQAQFAYVAETCKHAPDKIAQGYYGHAVAQGDGGHAAAQGNYGHAAAQGYYGHAVAQGDRGHAAAQGNYGHAAAQGNRGHATAQGNGGHAAAQGYKGHAAAQGNYGHAVAQGNYGHAAAQGYYGHAVAQGDGGHAAAQGYYGHAVAQGDGGHAAAQGNRGRAEVSGKNAIASALGVDGKARAALGSWIVCAEWETEDSERIKTVRAAQIDGEKLKPDTWYMLKDGEFVEAEDE